MTWASPPWISGTLSPSRKRTAPLPGGPKMLRGVRDVMMVAEDVMSTPLISVQEETGVLDAAKDNAGE